MLEILPDRRAPEARKPSAYSERWPGNRDRRVVVEKKPWALKVHTVMGI